MYTTLLFVTAISLMGSSTADNGGSITFGACTWRYAEDNVYASCENNEISRGFCTTGCGIQNGNLTGVCVC